MKNSTNSNVIIGLINPKSPQNVGSVLRAAGCYGAKSVYYTGERYARAKVHNTDTKKSRIIHTGGVLPRPYFQTLT